ncbi:WbqC family protein, partial [Clostridium sporogenes]|uniref:WbqC family protein n=1 Tax=Clostridium sporogenes TaxID=1509 RepID=UPI00313C85CB
AEIDTEENWQRKHFNSFDMNYSKARFYKDYRWILEDLYLNKKWDKISDFNIYATKLISQVLQIETQFISSLELHTDAHKDDKLIEICKRLNATHYLSGPAARNYIIPNKFEKANIQLEYIKYEYPKYKQIYEPFNHFVSVLDLIFNCGPNSSYYIWEWRDEKGDVKYDIL